MFSSVFVVQVLVGFRKQFINDFVFPAGPVLLVLIIMITVGGGCAEERKERRALMHIEIHAAIFAWYLCSFGPLFHALVAYHLERGGMPLHDAVGVNCKKGALMIYGLRGECYMIVRE